MDIAAGALAMLSTTAAVHLLTYRDGLSSWCTVMSSQPVFLHS